MSAGDDILPPGEDDDAALAAEYVLGLLDAKDRGAFERRLASEPALRRLVGEWAEYFAAFAEDVPESIPPPQMLDRVEIELWGRERGNWWRPLLIYIGGAVAAAVVAWVAVRGDLLIGTEQHLWTDLVVEEQGYVLLAHWAPESQTFMLLRDAGDFPLDAAIEIWLVPSPGAAAISVGLMQPEPLTQIPVPDALAALLAPGATVVISQEPPGGSPAGAPTGPILATGALEIRG